MLYWIHIYGILLLYMCIWICEVCKCYKYFSCQISIETIAVFFFVHQQTVSVTQTPHDNEGKWNVVCCAVSLWDLHVPVTDYYTVLDAWMRMFSLYYKKVREHMQHCVSLCAERTAHTAALCECVIKLWIKTMIKKQV